MSTPHIFIAYAPRGAGLRCALAYLAGQRDVYGWFTGPREDGVVAAQYFLVEDFHTMRPAHDHFVDHADLHSPWALDEARRQELARVQEAFVREWLFYRGQPHADEQLALYAQAELAAGEVNLRFERIARLYTQQPNWTYYSPGFGRPVLRHLGKRWPLEFRVDFAEAV